MKNNLGLALPVSLLLVAGVAQAQTSVTISGFVDVSLESVQTGRGTLNRMSTGQLNQSRIGFMGREDLGGGNAAIFDLEMPFSPDTGAGSSNGLFSRTSIVGLTSKTYGAVKLGRQQALSDEVLASMWALRWGSSINYFLYYGNTTQLVSNAIRYESPSLFGGFYVSAQYAMNEGSGIGSASEVAVRYKGPQLLVNSAYYVSKGHEFTEPNSTVKIGTIGASYDLGFATPSLVYQDTRTENSSLNRANKFSVAASASIPLGIHSLWVDYGIVHDRAKSGGNARAASVRYDYYLSKRTFLYTGVAQIWNGSNSYYQPMGASGSYPVFTSATGVSTGSAAAYNGHNTRSLIVGLRTMF